MTSVLEVRSVTVRFGETIALDDVNLTVESGEEVAILGPSGCGKSTLLRVVAGLQPVDEGTVLWDGEDIGSMPPHLRIFGLMFQDDALFPHLDVGDNVGFGLKMAGWDRSRIRTRVEEMLDLVGLEDFVERSVDRLSGGEAQRVALARTLAPEPRLIMLDEPLGSLDRLLRDRLVVDIGKILDETGIPSLYVTHDHEEAEAVAQTVALMRTGRIVQTGTFDDLRANPADQWVADFVR
ncbi:MAG: ATP-binding cassette domain-containing protein [Acidimicrobiia bacterium]|nr:ATP-binding cassette domain-containing protein [Acidimicrobiia bacterium]